MARRLKPSVPLVARASSRVSITPRRVARAITLFLALVVILWLVFPVPAELTESIYSRGIYPYMANVLIVISSAVPVSITAGLLIALPVWLAVSLLRSWRQREVTAWRWGLRWTERLLIGCVMMSAWFLLSWGLNYKRVNVETVLELGQTPATTDGFYTFALSLIDTMTDTADAPRDAVSIAASRDAGRSSLQQVIRELNGSRVYLPERAKTTLPGFLMLSGNAIGVISPWLLEAHVDGALPTPHYLTVTLHEFVHLAGYAGEADADFLAAVAGMRADNALMRYSTALSLFGKVAWRLPSEQYLTLYEQLPEQAQIDLENMQQAIRRYQVPDWFEKVQTRVYDNYLKSQGVEAGIRDYGRMVNWLVEAHEANWWADTGLPASGR